MPLTNSKLYSFPKKNMLRYKQSLIIHVKYISKLVNICNKIRSPNDYLQLFF